MRLLTKGTLDIKSQRFAQERKKPEKESMVE